MRYEPLSIFSRHRPFGGITGCAVLLSETGLPSKQKEDDALLDGMPWPNASQKADCDCQSWDNVDADEFSGTPPALPCNEGTKGELDMDTPWHVVQTVEQKLLLLLLLLVDSFDEGAEELQRTGTTDRTSLVSIL